MTHQVLFICTGNICRSPMAEALLRAALPEGGGWRVVSAGVSTLGGVRASAYAQDVLAERGVSLLEHRSREVTRELVADSAVIVAMTRQHADILGALFPDCRDRIHLMRSFDLDAPPQSDVADPFGGTLHDYRNCLALLLKSMPGLVDFLRGVFWQT